LSEAVEIQNILHYARSNAKSFAFDLCACANSCVLTAVLNATSFDFSLSLSLECTESWRLRTGQLMHHSCGAPQKQVPGRGVNYWALCLCTPRTCAI
jgi:hypothetical protein